MLEAEKTSNRHDSLVAELKHPYFYAAIILCGITGLLFISDNLIPGSHIPWYVVFGAFFSLDLGLLLGVKSAIFKELGWAATLAMAAVIVVCVFAALDLYEGTPLMDPRSEVNLLTALLPMAPFLFGYKTARKNSLSTR